jgi:hypothetical protein
MIDPNLDGISHINIYSQGKTILGRMLSNFYQYLIKTDDGAFASVEGYWYWLGIADCEEKECLRKLYGYNAKKKGTELRKKHGTRLDDDFEKKIIKAIWYKVRRHEYMFQKEMALLPFEHYYNFGGKVVDVKDNYTWMMEGISKMRNYILNKGEKQK